MSKAMGAVAAAFSVIGAIWVTLAVLDAAIVNGSDASDEEKAQATNQAVTTAVENEVIPWWIGPLEWLARTSPLLAVGLLILLRRSGQA